MTVWRQLRAALPWIVVGVLASALVLLALLPAAWITPRFGAASGGHVNLIDPDGSLWHGSATLMLAAGGDPAGATVLPGRIEWHTSFWPLFVGRVHMRMRQSEAMPEPVSIDATLHQATLSSGALVVPASLLTGLGAPFNTLALQGDVRLAWSDWRMFGRQHFGQLRVALDDMSSRISPVKPLGSWLVVVQAKGADATLDLSSLKGPLLLNGQGTLGGGHVSFAGTASATPQARDNLAGLLNLLGRPTGNGEIALSFVH